MNLLITICCGIVLGLVETAIAIPIIALIIGILYAANAIYCGVASE